jgi:hypothetical protein
MKKWRFNAVLQQQLAADGGVGSLLGATAVEAVTAEQQPVVQAESGEPGGQAEWVAEGGEGLESRPDEAAAVDAIEYADFSLPEGMEFNPALMGEFKTTLAGLRLNQEQAQLVADLGVKQAQSLWQQFSEANKQQQVALAEAFKVGEGSVQAKEFVQPEFVKQQAAQWSAAVQADKELGGEQLAENLAVARKALNTLGSPQLLQLLDKSGLGNHPDLVRAFFRAGRMMAEDAVLPGGTKPAGAAVGRTAHERAASRLYGG